MNTNESGHTFQVDLRGLVDLLSHHLYSSPRVYLRELMQNAVDAITARRLLDPSRPGADHHHHRPSRRRHHGARHRRRAHRGRTSTPSWRPSGAPPSGTPTAALDLTAAREDFIGQFGIGLLACFVVADEIVVVTRSAKEPGAPAVEWRGHSDGTYSIRALPPETVSEPGTMVTLTPRSEGSEWLEPHSVLQLARHFGSLLRYDVVVADKHGVESVVTDTPPVWERSYGSPLARRQALAAHGERTFGFVPLDTIDLDIPLVGLRGVAFVLPTPVNPSRRAGHRVHLKGMLLSDQAAELVPDWAFFVACVADTTGLRPTASREALYEDETLAAVRDAIGDRIRDWLVGVAASDLALLRRFVDVHHLAVKALARYDDQLLKLLLPWLPFETSDGTVSLDEFTRTHSSVIVTQTTEEFRQVAPIAAAAGLGVVNGGYVYDHELVHRLPDIRPGVAVMNLDPETVTAHLDAVDPAEELAVAAFLHRARAVADRFDTDVALRAFQPVGVPAMLMDSREARHERRRTELSQDADPLWAGILGSLRSQAPRAQLILNHLNPLIRKIADIADPDLSRTAIESLYGQALLLSRRPLRPADHALLNRSFIDLLEYATQSAHHTSGEGR